MKNIFLLFAVIVATASAKASPGDANTMFPILVCGESFAIYIDTGISGTVVSGHYFRSQGLVKFVRKFSSYNLFVGPRELASHDEKQFLPLTFITPVEDLKLPYGNYLLSNIGYQFQFIWARDTVRGNYDETNARLTTPDNKEVECKLASQFKAPY